MLRLSFNTYFFRNFLNNFNFFFQDTFLRRTQDTICSNLNFFRARANRFTGSLSRIRFLITDFNRSSNRLNLLFNDNDDQTDDNGNDNDDNGTRLLFRHLSRFSRLRSKRFKCNISSIFINRDRSSGSYVKKQPTTVMLGGWS